MAQQALGFSDQDIEKDPQKQAEVQKRIQFAYAILAVSLGVPVLHMGHPAGMHNGHIHDTYNKDDKDTWVPWAADMQDWQKNSVRFVREAFKFRHHHPELQREDFLTTGKAYPETGKEEVKWYNTAGNEMRSDDWKHGQCFSYVLSGKPTTVSDRRTKSGTATKVGPDVFIAVNDSPDTVTFTLPALAPAEKWTMAMDSSNLSGKASRHTVHAAESTIEIPSKTLMAFEGGKERALQTLYNTPGKSGAKRA